MRRPPGRVRARPPRRVRDVDQAQERDPGEQGEDGQRAPATSPHSTSTPRAAATAMHARPMPSIAPAWSCARRGSRLQTMQPATQAASTPTSRGNPGASPCTTEATSMALIISPGNASRRAGTAASPGTPGFATRRPPLWTDGRVAEPRERETGASAGSSRGRQPRARVRLFRLSRGAHALFPLQVLAGLRPAAGRMPALPGRAARASVVRGGASPESFRGLRAFGPSPDGARMGGRRSFRRCSSRAGSG